MAISFNESLLGSLWSRLGEVGALIVRARNDFRVGGNYVTEMRNLIDEITGGIVPSGDIQREDDLVSALRPALDRWRVDNWMSFAAELRKLAEALVLRHVARDASFSPGLPTGDPGGIFTPDTPVFAQAPAESIKDALLEVRRQAIAAAPDETFVDPDTLTVTSTAGSSPSNVGTGTVVTSTRRGDGLRTLCMFTETAKMYCELDGYDQKGIANHEVFRYIGPTYVDGLHPDWGESGYGSGAKTAIRVCDPSANGGPPNGTRGQVLVNGFETFSSGTPTGWQADVGTATTDFDTSATQAYFGSNSLKLIGGTAVLTTLRQIFNNSTGSPVKLKGYTQYAVCVRIYNDVDPAAGTMVVELVDSTNTVTTDDEGNSNTFTIVIADLTAATWTTNTGVFRTPRNVASGTRIRLRLTTAISAGTNTYVDSVAMWEMTEMYPGGPHLGIVAGSTQFVGTSAARDYFTIVSTNTPSGSVQPRATWHRLMDALFDLRGHNIIFPSTTSGTPNTILDSAIG